MFFNTGEVIWSNTSNAISIGKQMLEILLRTTNIALVLCDNTAFIACKKIFILWEQYSLKLSTIANLRFLY